MLHLPLAEVLSIYNVNIYPEIVMVLSEQFISLHVSRSYNKLQDISFFVLNRLFNMKLRSHLTILFLYTKAMDETDIVY
jgi:hypothetical protein